MSVIARAKEVSKSFGDQIAVDGLSFEINAGETFGLLGPNGAGKTTTISMLIGLLKPDSGEVAIGGKEGLSNDPTDPQVRRMIGVAPQQLSLYDELTGYENLKFFGQLYGLSGSYLSERIQWALDFAKLADRQNDRIDTYSGGMKRRINIAVAMIHDPQIVLLDEPTVGVDPQSRNHIFDCIEQLRSDGLTVLYTTHYMEEAQRLCDRVAIIDHGKMLAIDTVKGLLDRYGGASVVAGSLPQPPEGNPFGDRSVTLDGNDFRFESNQPIADIAELSNGGVEFNSVTIAQPDLESVFLSLTGRSLRDQ